MKQLRYIFLVLIFSFGTSVASFSQKVPPPPDQKSHGGGPPCDPGFRDVTGGPGVPPPPGLCLPIDDYVYLLMAVGVMYGCYKMRNLELG